MTIYTASQKAPNIDSGLSGGSMPWVDPLKLLAAQAAGAAGAITHKALEASRGSMGLGNKI